MARYEADQADLHHEARIIEPVLKGSGYLGRQTLFITEHSLVVYEHQFLSDRVRRVMFDQVTSLLCWRQLAWDYIAIATAIAFIPLLILLMIMVSEGGSGVGIALGLVLGVLGLLWLRYAFLRRLVVRLVRAGKTHEFKALTGPFRARRFTENLARAIAESHRNAEGEASPADAELEPLA